MYDAIALLSLEDYGSPCVQIYFFYSLIYSDTIPYIELSIIIRTYIPSSGPLGPDFG